MPTHNDKSVGKPKLGFFAQPPKKVYSKNYVIETALIRVEVNGAGAERPNAKLFSNWAAPLCVRRA